MQATDTQQQPEAKKRGQWLMLQCRFCNYMMHCVSHKATENKRNGQTYIETRYNCPHCDFWERLTIPRKIAATIVDEEFLPVLQPAETKETK